MRHRAFVVSGVVLAGCTDTPAAYFDKLVERMERFANEMCACKDKACVDSVHARRAEWSIEVERDATDEQRDYASKDDRPKKLNAPDGRYRKCMTWTLEPPLVVPPGTHPRLAGFADFANQMCACRDKACVEKVRVASSEWGKKQGPWHPDTETAKQELEIGQRYGACQHRLEVSP